MKRLIILVIGILSVSQAFDEAAFVRKYCKENLVESSITCSSFELSSYDWEDFVVREFTISNAEEVFLNGEVKYLNDYLFEKFPNAKHFSIKQVQDNLQLSKPFEREPLKPIKPLVEKLVINSQKKIIRTENSTSFNSLTKLKDLRISGLAIVDEHLLAKNTQLESLVIEGSTIGTLSPKAFKNLKKLTKLDLSRLGLTTDMLDLKLLSSQSKLTCLSLSGNSITFVPLSNFFPTSLKNLDLSSNRISIITKNHFKTLKNLASLDLSNNKIYVISRDSFLANKKLIFVSLNSNNIKAFHENLLRSQNNLLHFDVSKNYLNEIKSFVGASELQYLNVSYNRLKVANEESYSVKSVSLDFSHNSIDKISFSTGSENLKYLYLSENNIPSSEVTRNKFTKAKNLEVLDLENNKITWIYDDAFDDMENLQIIKY